MKSHIPQHLKKITRSRNFRLGVLITGFVLFIVTTTYGVSKVGTVFRMIKQGISELAEVEKPEQAAERPQVEPEKPKEVCGCTKHHVRFKRDNYELHRKHAKKLNNSTLLTDKIIHSSKNLVKVKSGTGYVIDSYKLTHSHAYLNKYAYEVLKEMGRLYADQVEGTEAEGSAFHLSSLTRTHEQQKKLSRSAGGRNATKKESAHSYGASFDIYKLDGSNSCHVARKAFENVLKEFQKSGKVLLCPEGNCIHVTVKK